jgi:hypothetical protein
MRRAPSLLWAGFDRGGRRWQPEVRRGRRAFSCASPRSTVSITVSRVAIEMYAEAPATRPDLANALGFPSLT